MTSSRRKTIKNKVKPKLQKTYIIIGSVIAITIILLYGYFKTNSENYNNIKLDKNNYLVYTKYSNMNTKYTKEVPYVNLKADVFKEVNADIINFCENYIKAEKSIITYEYDVNGIILSLVVKVINNDTTFAPEPYFRTYNINLETQEVISDEVLLQFFQVNKSTIENKIKRKLQTYYGEIIEEKYYSSNECSYECFLKYRGIDKYLDYVSYYVRDGELIAFKTFIAHSIFGEEEYFNDKSFEFEISKAPAS